jgi:hypothetical protein
VIFLALRVGKILEIAHRMWSVTLSVPLAERSIVIDAVIDEVVT